MKDNVLMRVIARWNIPFMVMFGAYTQVHGELGPGGGFQAGIIVAAAFILYGMVFGAAAMRRIVPRWLTDLMAVLGVMVFAGMGLLALAMGYEFLDHSVLIPSDPGAAEPWGMTTVEYGVGITVFAVMMTIFNEISEGTDEPGEVAEGKA